MSCNNFVNAKTQQLLLKSRRSIEYHSKMKSTAINLPQATLTSEVGQINSKTFDNKFGITQSSLFPTVYIHQKKVLKEELNTAVLAAQLNKIQIKNKTRFVKNR